MRIIEPSFEIIKDCVNLRTLERIGRVCYKSEDRITEDSAEGFIRRIIQNGHESVLEHGSVTVQVVCDRGVSHEIVRHRMFSFTQESTRYCNYAEGRFGGEIAVIDPVFWEDGGELYELWRVAMEVCEEVYLYMLSLGATPQQARTVLPNSLKTELVITGNIRLRTAPDAHPQMREIAVPMLEEFSRRWPVVFEDIANANEMAAKDAGGAKTIS